MKLSSHEPSLGDEDVVLARKVVAALRQAGFSPPDVCELAGAFAAEDTRVRRVIAFLAHAGTLVAVAPEMYFHKEAVNRAREFVLRELREKGKLNLQAAKQFTGTSRKYLLPLMEYFDEVGLTLREGGKRVAGENGRRPGPST